MKNKWIMMILFFLYGILVTSVNVSAHGNARALVVSRGDYTGKSNDLSPGPENDGKNFRRILSQAYGEKIEVTSLEKANAQNAESLMRVIRNTFADSDADDVNYFFYSGHGNPEGIMLETDECLSAESLAQAFSGVKGTNFLVFDCCYSGNLIARDLSQEGVMDSFVRKFQESLSNIKARSAITNNSFHVIAASSEDELSIQGQIDSSGTVIGFFTAAISAGCGIDFTKVNEKKGYSCTVMADGNRDGNVTLNELYHYVQSVLHTSHATVWPEEDNTVFIPVKTEQIPRTSIHNVQFTWNGNDTPALELSYSSQGNGTFQAALYRSGSSSYNTLSDLDNAIIMTVNPEVTSYPYQDTDQAVRWTFSGDAQHSSVSMPLGITSIPKGDYFLLINEKGGNTGCYLFRLQIEKSIYVSEYNSITLQASDTYSIENDGTFPIEVNLGDNTSPNCYLLPITCVITSQFGKKVFIRSVNETEIMQTGQSYSHFCSFVWDGTSPEGKQVAAGTYTLTVMVGNNGSIKTMKHIIRVESLAEESPDYPLYTDAPVHTSDTLLISGQTIHLAEGPFVYHGLAICPEVRIGGLINGYDYLVSYRDNINAGTASVLITGIGKYTGSALKTYRILSAPLSNVSVKIQKNLKYTGKKCQAKTTLTYLDHTLQSGKDYTLSYKNNRNPGYATVIIEGKGNYSGKTSIKFKILPREPGALKIKKTKGKMRTLYWEKSSGVNGYKVQYCSGSKFRKKVKTHIISNKNAKKAAIKLPSTHKKYYFRICSYKIVNGKKWCSKWNYFM